MWMGRTLLSEPPLPPPPPTCPPCPTHALSFVRPPIAFLLPVKALRPQLVQPQLVKVLQRHPLLSPARQLLLLLVRQLQPLQPLVRR